jgi:hypothetical protein
VSNQLEVVSVRMFSFLKLVGRFQRRACGSQRELGFSAYQAINILLLNLKLKFSFQVEVST